MCSCVHHLHVRKIDLLVAAPEKRIFSFSQEKRFRKDLWQHVSTKNDATNAAELLENSETHIESERTTAIEWQGTIWDVWDQAA